ncbi:MAG: AmmeMemoRadiSam system radical SAM enzyme [Candidatus Diapherotrites archaeon]|nr:AmmeMemoRadiSam system radical SAM enzyme [Candidatus Diapherotrites archaeon]
MKFKEALLWKKLNDKKVQCRACNRFCVIEDNKTGNCGVRKNIDGKLFCLVYGRTLSNAIDPIEKKPLFHFKPSSECSSISTYGCNFKCLFCQNFNISQEFVEKDILSVPYTDPREVVDFTIENSLEIISYTYNEPTVFFEYALDIMKIAKKKGLYNVWVSNGYFSKDLFDLIKPYLDAVNIDLKGNDSFYEKICGNVKRQFVLDNIELCHKNNIHVEVTNLIIPTLNDNDKDISEVCSFIASLDKDIPLHFSRFYPCYKLNDFSSTPKETLVRAKKISEKFGLHYVYLGNLGTEENTYCKNCGNLLIKRFYYNTEILGLDGSFCRKCRTKADIIL